MELKGIDILNISEVFSFLATKEIQEIFLLLCLIMVNHITFLQK